MDRIALKICWVYFFRKHPLTSPHFDPCPESYDLLAKDNNAQSDCIGLHLALLIKKKIRNGLIYVHKTYLSVNSIIIALGH